MTYTAQDYKDIIAAEKEFLEPYGGSLWNVSDEHAAKMLHGLSHRVSEPLYLHERDKRAVRKLGKILWKFIQASRELYHINDDFRELLDWGKPEYMRVWDKVDAPCIRIDAGVTLNGLKGYEFGFNINGLALSHLIKQAYIACGKIANRDELKDSLSSYLRFCTGGTVAFTEEGYRKQFEYLAKEVLSTEDEIWDAQAVDSNFNPQQVVFRAFQDWEAEQNPYVQKLIEGKNKIFPSINQRLETKLYMATDREFEKFYLSKMGEADFDFLSNFFPLTYVVNWKRGLPEGAKEILDFADAKDQLAVLKVVSGLNGYGCKGVYFLNDCSRDNAVSLLNQAIQDQKNRWILQDFNRALQRNVPYLERDGSIAVMKARTLVRITYGSDGEVLDGTAISCPDTDKLHGMATATWAPIESS